MSNGKFVGGPISQDAIKAMFAPDPTGIWRLVGGESDQHECKASFGLKHPGAWLRAVAALANNRGGYVLFGVHDKDSKHQDGRDMSFAVIGFQNDEFFRTDPSEIAQRLKSTFDPTPHVKATTVIIDSKRVGVLFVEKHPSRPVIARRADDKIAEGDIFYRYSGLSTRIKYSDLRAIMDERARELTVGPMEDFMMGPIKRIDANSADSNASTAPPILLAFSDAWHHFKANFWGDGLPDTHLQQSVLVSWGGLLLPTLFLFMLEFNQAKLPPSASSLDAPFFWFDGLAYAFFSVLILYSLLRWSRRKKIRGWQ